MDMLRRSWEIWLAVVKILGTVQMVILLTVVYIVFVPLLFVPAGWVADPLKLRRTGQSTWLRRCDSVQDIASLRGQG